MTGPERERSSIRLLALIPVLVLVVQVAGCASDNGSRTDRMSVSLSLPVQADGDTPATTDPASAHRKAAAGFVDALVQLPGFLPFETTLGFERRALASDPFLRALERATRLRGYGVRLSTTLGGRHEVSHVAEIAKDGQVTRTVAFGKAQMRRRFAATDDGAGVAASSLFIRGVDASRVRIGPKQQQPSAKGVLTNGDDTVSATRRADDAASADSRTGMDTRSLPTPRNVAELGQSNYAGVFEAYTNIREVILVFPNDSMVLGNDNKRVINRMLEGVDPQLDLFSILGCSFGKSAVENGNEILANGRANRVREELLLAGVPARRILDEGCWAGAPEENFPGRGVVLTVKRTLG